MSGVHFVDGRYYVEVKRSANIGDYVTKDGILRTVTRINEEWDSVEFDSYVDEDDDYVCGWCSEYYKTLEPIGDKECCGAADPSVTDLLANLARRVSSLEQQLSATQSNVEKLAEELENAKHRVSKHATMFGIVEERVGMLTDDIITLDERSQVLNAINKFYEEGSR
jgi:hypothetical protein